jgi:hypothetical protein
MLQKTWTETVETEEQALCWLGEWMPAEDLVQLARLLQEAQEHGYAVVKVMVNDRRLDGFRLEKMYK